MLKARSLRPVFRPSAAHHLLLAAALLAPAFHEFLEERPACKEAQAFPASGAAFEVACGGERPCQDSNHHHHRHHQHEQCPTCRTSHEGAPLPLPTQARAPLADHARRMPERETRSPASIFCLTHAARAPPVLS